MTAQTAWYESFFSGLVLEAQRRLAGDAQTRAEADFLQQAFASPPGARVADVPCGDGRLALELARRGYRVTGVDIAGPFVEAANRQARASGLPADFRQGDMRDLPWVGEFDHAFCFGNSFGYFDDAGNRDFLHAVARTLKPGGRFVLETRLAAEGLFGQFAHRRWYPLGDLYFLHEPRYDPVTGRVTSAYTLIRNGEVEKREAVYQVYLCRDLLALLREAGFAALETYGSPAREPYQLGSTGLWVVATKG